MRIEPPRPTSPIAQSPEPRSSDSGFAISSPPAQAAAATRAVSPSLAAGAILALQAVDDIQQRRARHVRRGHDSLDALERLKLGLLEGGAPGEVRTTLNRLFAGRETTGDGALDSIMTDIDVRVAVELAKLERV
jgi:hypothetical protein